MLHGFRHVDVGDFRPGVKHLVCRQAEVCFRQAVAIIVPGQLQNGLLCFRRRVVDDHVHQEPVQLRFGQRVGAFLLDGVLGCHNQEQPVQREGAHAHADLPFAHGFQKSRLYLGGGPVDFVGEHEIMEYRTTLEFELPCFRTVDFTAGDVRGQQVRRELDPVKVAFQVLGEGLDGGGFRQSGCALYQQVAVCKQGDQQTIHQLFLPDYPFG